MDKNNLRQEYGNETGEKIRVEMFVTYNNDYVKWLEEKVVKLLNIPSVSNSFKELNIKQFESWVKKEGYSKCDFLHYEKENKSITVHNLIMEYRRHNF